MTPPLTVTLLYHPANPTAGALAAGVIGQLDAVTPETGPAGTMLRVPVRVRCQPWRHNALRAVPAPAAGQLAVIIVLHCPLIDAERPKWAAALAALPPPPGPGPTAPNAPVLRLHVDLAPGLTPLPGFSAWQGLKLFTWTRFADASPLDDAARANRLALRVIDAIRRHPLISDSQTPTLQHCDREPVFISHAKADGDALAAAIAAHAGHPDHDLHLDTFFDRATLEAGRDWAEGLRTAAAAAAMLVLRTDAYDSRPWCAEELITAKKYRRPMLLVDLTKRAVERTLPYLGRLPMLRGPLDGPAAIEQVLLALWREGLRCDLVRKAGAGCTVLPRWPEALDLTFLAASTPATVLYPDPPLPRVEYDLLAPLLGKKLVSLSEMTTP